MKSTKSIISNILYKNPGIEIRRSPKDGWGVFARRNIKENSILEESPLVLVHKEKILDVHEFYRYCYDFDDEVAMLGLGYAGLYNHSSDPNVEWVKDSVNMVMKHFTTRDIKAGEELFIDYGEENIGFDVN